MSQPDEPLPPWPLEAIWERVVPTLPGFTIECLPEVDSTNSELMRRCRAGALEPVLLLAERQTAGRGRLGRQWHTPAGSALTFSVALPMAPADWGGLSLAVGTSLAESLRTLTGADVRLKWPNDLWLHGHKLGGILVETAGSGTGAVRCVVVGVGLNVREPAPGWQPPASPGQALAARPPAWLADSAPLLQAPAVLQAVAAPLVADLQRFEREGFAAFEKRFAPLDLLAGREVVLSDGRQGRASGVGRSGALRLEVDGQLQEVVSGEVSVRPR